MKTTRGSGNKEGEWRLEGDLYRAACYESMRTRETRDERGQQTSLLGSLGYKSDDNGRGERSREHMGGVSVMPDITALIVNL